MGGLEIQGHCLGQVVYGVSAPCGGFVLSYCYSAIGVGRLALRGGFAFKSSRPQFGAGPRRQEKPKSAIGDTARAYFLRMGAARRLHPNHRTYLVNAFSR